jgi:uracil-DNA glycosylase family 4
LEETGIDRSQTYVTNVVKHFKWKLRGKRRIHKKPNAGEISACRPWLEAEIAMIKPKVIVALGATAAQALIGPKFRVTKQRSNPPSHRR